MWRPINTAREGRRWMSPGNCARHFRHDDKCVGREGDCVNSLLTGPQYRLEIDERQYKITQKITQNCEQNYKMSPQRRVITLEPGTTKNRDGREVVMTDAVCNLLVALVHGK